MGIAPLAPTVEVARPMTPSSNPAALAFDAIAPQFDQRFGPWASVAAQRRAVRAALLREFPSAGKILELGGGTGEDAEFLAAMGFQVLLTDPSPAMVSIALNKLVSPEFSAPESSAEILAAEDMEEFAGHKLASGEALFDGAFSNFAPLNCVVDLNPVARGLARLLKPGAPAMLVVFGVFCPGEMATELLRGRPRNAFRRFQRGRAAARLAGHDFHVVYHRRADLLRTFAPWFKLEKRLGIGVAVPPSAAEPWITRHPRLLAAMESIDRLVSRPLTCFGDHVLCQFRRTHVPVP